MLDDEDLFLQDATVRFGGLWRARDLILESRIGCGLRMPRVDSVGHAVVVERETDQQAS